MGGAELPPGGLWAQAASSSQGMAGTRFGGFSGRGKAEKYPLRGVHEECYVHAGNTRGPRATRERTGCPPRPPPFPTASTLGGNNQGTGESYGHKAASQLTQRDSPDGPFHQPQLRA